MVVQDTLIFPCVLATVSFCALEVHLQKGSKIRICFLQWWKKQFKVLTFISLDIWEPLMDSWELMDLHWSETGLTIQVKHKSPVAAIALCLTCHFSPLGPNPYGLRPDQGYLQTTLEVCACILPRIYSPAWKDQIIHLFPSREDHLSPLS